MILDIGSINMDICLQVKEIPLAGETVLSQGVLKSPGGKGANQAVAAAKLGSHVVMLGCIGNDENGRVLLESLGNAGVDIQYLMQKDNVPSSTAYICVSEAGENSIVVDSSANRLVFPAYLRQHESLFQRADFCLLQMEIPVETIYTAIALCHAHGVKVVLNPSPLSSFDFSLLRHIDYLIPNKAEASTPLGKNFDDATEQDWNDFMEKYEIQNLIVTLGHSGACRYKIGEPPVFHPTKPRIEVCLMQSLRFFSAMTPKILKFFRHGSEKAVTTTALFFALLYNIRTICSYRRVLRHLHENALTAADLSRIQNALTFLSPLCRDTREAHEDMMSVPLKTDALLRAGR